jgi:hypothetical protein
MKTISLEENWFVSDRPFYVILQHKMFIFGSSLNLTRNKIKSTITINNNNFISEWNFSNVQQKSVIIFLEFCLQNNIHKKKEKEKNTKLESFFFFANTIKHIMI